jgi:hypothetical protein
MFLALRGNALGSVFTHSEPGPMSPKLAQPRDSSGPTGSVGRFAAEVSARRTRPGREFHGRVDLNYVGAADRETMLSERRKVEQAVRKIEWEVARIAG